MEQPLWVLAEGWLQRETCFPDVGHRMKMGLEGISFSRHVCSEELEIGKVTSERMWDAW